MLGGAPLTPIKNPRAAPGGYEAINIPMAVDGRSCWRWHLGPNVPGVGWLVLLGHLRRCKRSVDGSDVPHPVSELTTCPRLGEDCWSRGLQSACFWLVARWRVVHPGASLVDASRFAPPLALGNRELHALPWRPSGSRVGCLGKFSGPIAVPAVAVVAIAACTASSPPPSADARAQPLARGRGAHAAAATALPDPATPGRW